MVTGSCLCGDVAWQAEGSLELMHHCHCSMCRKAHGSAFATMVAAPLATFRWLRGASGVRRYRSSADSERAFCGRCGSCLPGDATAERIFMPVGALDDDPGVRALVHIFVASKAPWHEITDALPRFDTFPPGYETPNVAAPPRPEARPGASVGSCLCGAVAYEIDGEVGPIRSCYCARCRKARGAAHASNAFVPLGALRWLRGEELVRSYKVPEAKRYTQVFCDTCGSKLPRESPELGMAVVPAGSLDAAPNAREGVHIFVGSKAAWVEITDDRPQYDDYPPS